MIGNKPLHRHLVEYRILSITVLVWAGWLMYIAFDWVTTIPHELLGIHHAGLIGAIFAPVAAIFKFSLDFALDGKIDNQ